MALEKVGSKALSIVKEFTSDEKHSKPKKKVLGEDEYIDNIEKIIVRDFYPDLPKMAVQKEYLEAKEKNDIEALRRIHIKYGPKRPTTSGPTPSIYTTPSTFETPVEKPKQTPKPGGNQENSEQGDKGHATHNPEPAKKKDPTDMPLDKYLAKNTSEDNASFNQIMEDSEAKRKIKNAWLYEKEKEQSEELTATLALPGVEQQAIQGSNGKVKTWTYQPRNSVMYVPDGMELSAKEAILKKEKQNLEITHTNTRFTSNPFNQTQSKNQINHAASIKTILAHGKVGVDGKEILPDATPKVNGFGFVATPSPAPGVEDSPMMTWGEIEGTPFRLDGGDTPVQATPGGPQFKIPPVPSRDRIGLELAEEASKAHRDRKKKAFDTCRGNFTTPTPTFGSASKSSRLASMSPAAQRLMSSKLGVRTHTDKALRASYTPSPSHRSFTEKTPILTKTPTPGSSSRRRNPVVAGSKTPIGTPGSTRSVKDSESTPKRTAGSDMSSLTDNLLNLPKRAKATDFF